MYYYILEPQKEKTSRFAERLGDQLTDLGIAGEMVTVSALKTIDDLLGIGITKGYATLVAVGSDRHIHDVINHLMHRPASERPVLGMIPTERDSDVASLIGTSTLGSSLETLKLRRLAHATLAHIGPGVAGPSYLLTRATVTPPRPILVRATVDDATIETRARLIAVTGDGQLKIETAAGTGQRVRTWLAWLVGTTLPAHTESYLHGNQIELSTELPLPLIRSGVTIATTPAHVRTIRRALRLIVARATLSLKDQQPEGAHSS